MTCWNTHTVCACCLRVALHPCLQIILSVAEHHSNLVPWQLVAQKTGAVLKHVRLTDTQELDMQVRRGCLEGCKWDGEHRAGRQGRQ
jgi:selenocysteine lyase/cysteine desulfurase